MIHQIDDPRHTTNVAADDTPNQEINNNTNNNSNSNNNVLLLVLARAHMYEDALEEKFILQNTFWDMLVRLFRREANEAKDSIIRAQSESDRITSSNNIIKKYTMDCNKAKESSKRELVKIENNNINQYPHTIANVIIRNEDLLFDYLERATTLFTEHVSELNYESHENNVERMELVTDCLTEKSLFLVSEETSPLYHHFYYQLQQKESDYLVNILIPGMVLQCRRAVFEMCWLTTEMCFKKMSEIVLRESFFGLGRKMNQNNNKILDRSHHHHHQVIVTDSASKFYKSLRVAAGGSCMKPIEDEGGRYNDDDDDH
eukprot:PhM_4_TR18682/c0_g1_i5/m.46286